MIPGKIDTNKLRKVIDERSKERWALIPVLQEIQNEFGYIPPESIPLVADALNLFPSQVQGVITFYAGFSLEPKGRYVVRVCRGTACHVKGGRSILRYLKKELHLNEGQTTPDFMFTLETVACLGACILAPAMMVNRNYYGKLSPSKLTTILEEYSRKT